VSAAPEDAAGLIRLPEGLPAAARDKVAQVIGFLDGPFAAALGAFVEILGFLDGPGAAAMEGQEVEEYLLEAVRDGGRKALQGFFDQRAEREQRVPEVTGADEVTRRRAERNRARSLGTSFGDVTVRRIAYRKPRSAAAGADLHPADGQLNLPPGRDSWPLQKLTVLHGAKGSYQDATDAVQLATGQKIGKRQAEQMMIAAAADYEDFYRTPERRPPPGIAPGDVLVLQGDGKGIVVRPDQMRPEAARNAARSVPKQQGRLSRGEVKNRKRMAEVGAVYDITPVPRAPDDILPPPGPCPDPPARPPRARHKLVTASVAGSAASVVAATFDEAERRDPQHQRTWTVLADGNKHQLDRFAAEAADRGITVTITIDLIHVIEYLWGAAWCFHPEASPDAGPWVRRCARAVLDGRAADVAAAIRAQATATEGLSKTKRAAAERTARYLETKAPWLDYPKALANGWPISTGVIEGACRHLVKDRMDITGARWTVRGAEAVLKIRSLITSGDFDAYWTCHLQRERQRNHGSRYLNGQIPQAA
jgi:hypothetical protein